MAEPNRIARHAPEWLRDLEEYIEIWNIFPALDDADAQIEYNNNQWFIDTATEEGLTRWETALGLPHTGTIEDRRQEILFYLQAKIPYTMRWLQGYLRIQWDDPKPHAVIHLNGDYILTLQPKDDILKEQFEAILRRKIPANIEIEWLPAPLCIWDYYLGQGCYQSWQIDLLSSAIYSVPQDMPTYYGAGVYESVKHYFDKQEGGVPEVDYVSFNLSQAKYNTNVTAYLKSMIRQRLLSDFKVELVDSEFNPVCDVYVRELSTTQNLYGLSYLDVYTLDRISIPRFYITTGVRYYFKFTTFGYAATYAQAMFSETDGLLQLKFGMPNLYSDLKEINNFNKTRAYGQADMNGSGTITNEDIDIRNELYDANTNFRSVEDDLVTDTDLLYSIASGDSNVFVGSEPDTRRLSAVTYVNQTYVAEYNDHLARVQGADASASNTIIVNEVS